MKTVLDQPAGERADVLLGNFPVLADYGLLNCARNLELQQRLLCVVEEILAFGEQSWRCLERVQDPLLKVSPALLKVVIRAPQHHVAYVDSTIFSGDRCWSVYVDAVARCFECLQQLRQRLGVSHLPWRWMHKGCRSPRATVTRHQPVCRSPGGGNCNLRARTSRFSQNPANPKVFDREILISPYLIIPLPGKPQKLQKGKVDRKVHFRQVPPWCLHIC
jgi:hypothetical protein